MASSEDLVIGIFLPIFGGMMNATWNLPGKPDAPLWLRVVKAPGQSKREGWEWENFWLANQAFSVLITLIYILPLLGPDTINQAHALAGEAATWTVVGVSVLWGFGSIGFGLAIKLVGIGLGTAMTMSVIVIMGVVWPILVNVSRPEGAAAACIAAGVIIGVVGIAMLGMACRLRELRRAEKTAVRGMSYIPTPMFMPGMAIPPNGPLGGNALWTSVRSSAVPIASGSVAPMSVGAAAPTSVGSVAGSAAPAGVGGALYTFERSTATQTAQTSAERYGYASRPHQHATVCFVPQGVFATGANFGSADAAPPFVGGSTGVRAHRPAVEPITEEAQEKPLTAARSVALCLTAGLVASTLQLAFVLGGSIASAAESIGVSPILSAGVIWLPAFCISGLVNVLYAAWLLTRNETWSCFSFSCVGEPHRWALSLMSAVFFCGHIHLYGTASTLLGTLGPVIAWPVLMCCTMVFGQLWGEYLQEFRKDDAGRKLNYLATVVLVTAIIITAIAAVVE